MANDEEAAPPMAIASIENAIRCDRGQACRFRKGFCKGQRLYRHSHHYRVRNFCTSGGIEKLSSPHIPHSTGFVNLLPG